MIPNCLIYDLPSLTDHLQIDNVFFVEYYLTVMKTDLHPKNYRPVVFQDLNDNTTFLTRSTVETEETITLDGKEYPLVKVHISSSSHPFFTGQEKMIDIEGRVDKFKARRAAAEAKANDMKKAASKDRRAAKAPKADETQKIGSLKPGKK